jgi:serine-type D-Ala-D-Ala carboxypeptidase (penicillin-binding protein 5/6)
MTATQAFAGIRFFLKAAAVVALALASFTAPASAQRFETKAKHAILIDAETDTVLFAKDADARMPPASMGKLMTVAVIFKALETGRLRPDDEFVVSETAWRQGGAGSGGSTMFAKLGSSIRIEDLLHGIIIQSGNDSCIIVAEGMAGTEPTFSDLMNQESRALGLDGSHWKNSTGLPDPDQYTTARDLAKLAKHLIDDYPELYKIFAQPEFTWNKIRQRNRNPLIEMNIGADGLKTGHTEEAGYGLVGSAVRDGQRLIVVIGGTKSDKERAEEARKLLDWGFRAFERVNLFPNGEVIGEVNVFGGDRSTLGVVSKGPLDLLLPVGSRDLIKAQVVYDGPVQAPVEEGQPIGVIRITTGEGMTKEAPVFAATDIGTGTLQQRALDGIEELLLGWW